MGTGPARRSTRDDYEQRIRLVQRHLETNIDDELRPAALAEIAGLSLHHFHRVFRGITGESVMEHLRRLRLERAARHLRDSSRPVVDIAFAAGYASHEGFTRAFGEAFALSPSAYRARPRPLTHRRRCAPTASPADVEVRAESELTVLALRHVGPPTGIGATWECLDAWLADHRSTLGLPARWTPRRFGIAPDDPQITNEQQFRYDACLTVPPGLGERVAAGPVSILTLPTATYAVATHVGPYETLADGYLSLLGGWFPDSGLVPAAAPAIEYYRSAPSGASDERVVTEIRVAVEERGWMH